MNPVLRPALYALCFDAIGLQHKGGPLFWSFPCDESGAVHEDLLSAWSYAQYQRCRENKEDAFAPPVVRDLNNPHLWHPRFKKAHPEP